MAQRQFRSDDTTTWAEKYGDGSAGASTISGNTTDDATRTPKTTLSVASGATAATFGSFTGFTDGDLVLLYQTRNGGAGAGAWELNKIASHVGTAVVLAYATMQAYDTTAQVIKLTQFSNFTVNTGVTLTAQAWDGSVGGVLPVLCNGTLSVVGNISATGKGYRPGAGVTGSSNGQQGEGTLAAQGTVSVAANGNGGSGGVHNQNAGFGEGGAGGGHSATGGLGDGSGGAGGTTSGVAGLTTMTPGGGGGSGGNDGNASASGVGGIAGGVVLLICGTVSITGTVVANGNNGNNNSGEFGGGGAGGAGGSILVKGDNVTLGSSLLTATGGIGGEGFSTTHTGGTGSTGRIHADYGTAISGTTNPTIDSRNDTTLRQAVAPTVTTDSVTGVGSSSATANGTVSSDGGGTVTERGFVLATTVNPTTANTKFVVGGTTGVMTVNLTGLTPSTSYHVRAYATNSAGTSYGADLPFTTPAAIPLPQTLRTTNIRTTAIDVDCLLTSDQPTAITERGIVWSTGSSPTTSNSKATSPGTTDTFTLSMVKLSAQTVYFVRSYCITAAGTFYGNTLRVVTSTRRIRKHFIYRIYTPLGAYVETWSPEVISDPDFKININSGPGEMVVQLARKFDDFGEDVDVKLNNKVQCFVVDNDNVNGLLLYTGYISGYRPVIDEVKEYIEVTLFSYVGELSRMILRDATGNTTVTYNSYDPSVMLRDIVDKYRAIGGNLNYSALSVQNTNTSVSYTFITNTIKECLDKIIELCPVGWYYRVDPDGTIYLQPKNVLSDHAFSVGLEVERLRTFRRIEDLVNRVLFTGGGTPALFRKYENTSSQATYGLYEKKVVDQRVTVAATASTISNRILDNQKDPEIRSTLVVIDNNGPATRGYDLESVKVGQTFKIKNLKNSVSASALWDVAQWDVDVWDQTLANAAADVIQILSIHYQPDSIEIEASSRLPQVAKRIEDVDRNLQNSQTVNNPAAPT
jgi:hypothetical protein